LSVKGIVKELEESSKSRVHFQFKLAAAQLREQWGRSDATIGIHSLQHSILASSHSSAGSWSRPASPRRKGPSTSKDLRPPLPFWHPIPNNRPISTAPQPHPGSLAKCRTPPQPLAPQPLPPRQPLRRAGCFIPAPTGSPCAVREVDL
jgi:hypothetical protein